MPHRKKWIAGALAAVVVSAAIVRILTFHPLPLDAPGTLRPLLYAFSIAFVWQPDAWHSACYVWMLVPTILAFVNHFVPHRNRAMQILFSHALFFIAIAAALFICRLPALLAPEYNPDESQFLAAAEKLFIDPVYFRSVDCGTSGPLNIYPLMLPALVGLSPDLASGRAIALVIVICSIYILYRTFRLLVPDSLARIGVLPAAALFPVLTTDDYQHYSSEYVSLMLFSIAAYFTIRTILAPERHSVNIFVLGLLTTAAFFAKMQAMPLLGAISGFTLAYIGSQVPVREWWRPASVFAAGLILLPLVNLVVCLATGVTGDFWMSYVVANVHYTGVAKPAPGWFPNFIHAVPELRMWIGATAIALLLTPLRMSSAARWAGTFFAFTLVAAVFCVFAPHRDFIHYTLLLILPLAATAAWPVLARPNAERLMLFGIVMLMAQVLLWTEPYSPRFSSLPAKLRTPEGDFIQNITRPDDQIVTWGWNTYPYLSSGRVAGTRDTNMVEFFTPNAGVNKFYRGRFLRDMQRTRPALFIDAVGPTSFNGDAGEFRDPDRGGFTVYPEIKSYIEREYVFIGERYYQRYYLRKDRVTPTMLTELAGNPG